ncbi:MAG: hypothetical protein WBX38_03080 [Candidatus Sulfotelmatobacter sp.]
MKRLLWFLLAGMLQAQTVAYYVSPTGSDSNSGTLSAPLATIQKAESLVVKNYLGTNCAAQTQPITVQFLAGTWYDVDLNWTVADSGCGSAAPVVFENYPGASVEFSAGSRITNWTAGGNATWQATLPAGTVNFESFYYNGVRRYRPRLTSTGNILGDQFRIAGNVAGDYDRFYYNPSDPISGTWENYSPSAGNPCNQPAGPAGLQGDIEITVFEMWDTSVERISCIDTVNHLIYLTGSTGTGKFHGYILDHRYVVENVRNSFLLPRQWFLDRSVTPWVLNYIANSGENPNLDTVVIPQQAQVLSATGLQYRTFSGITFSGDNYVVPAKGYAGSQTESLVPAAVKCNDCSYVTFESDTFTNIGGYALGFPTDNKGTAIGDVVENNLLYDLGAGGLVTGRLTSGAETDANVFQQATVENNLVQGYGRRFAGAAGIAHLIGHDIVTANNDINDGYSQGIELCFPNTANSCAGKSQSNGAYNLTTSYNHIWNLGEGLLNDFGGIYMATYNATGDVLNNNRIHDISDASTQDVDGYGGNGIYIDRGGPISITNNLVYRVVNSLNMTIGPAEKNQMIAAKNNIFAYARKTIEQMYTCPAAGYSQFSLSNNIILADRTLKSVPQFALQWLVTYTGTPVGSVQSFVSNDYWNTAEMLSSDTHAFNSQTLNCTAKTYYNFSNWQKHGEDAGSLIVNPGFTNPLYPNDNFTFLNGPPATGFVAFCTVGPGANCPGRTSGATIPAVPAGFQTDPFNPVTDY